MDYGARPSLRSNRVDPVHDSSGVAESVAAATEKFAAIYGQKKEKDSRLDYALAKNELTKLDIQKRQELKERTDWEKFDEDYTNGYNDGRDEIMSKYTRLSPADRALLSAESDVIRERGRVYAADTARGLEIGQGRTQVKEQLDFALEAIQIAPPEQQTQLMLDALETVTAATQGRTAYFSEEEALSLIQGFVAKASVDSLENMDKADMIAEIELSLAHRKARGAMTREDIAAGKGSGSIADFLHANVLEEMLDDAKEEHKNKTQYGAVFGIIDVVEADNPGTSADAFEAQREQALAMLDPNDEDYGEKRNILEQELAQRQNRKAGLQAQRESETALELTNWIDETIASDPENPPTIGDLKQMPIWTKLSPQGKKAAEDYVRLRAEGHEYALADDDDFLLKWVQMSPEDQIAMMPKFESFEIKSRLTRDTWEGLLSEARARKDASERPGPANIWRGDAQDEVLANMLVGEEGLFRRVPTPGSPDDKRYKRIDGAVNRALTAESMRRYRETGNGQLYPEDIERITGEILSREIFIRQGWFTDDTRTVMADVIRFDLVPDGRGGQRAINIELEDEAEKAFVPYDQWKEELSDKPSPTGTGFITVEQMLRNFSDNPDGVSKKDLEEAYFYLNALPEEQGLEYARRRMQGEAGL